MHWEVLEMGPTRPSVSMVRCQGQPSETLWAEGCHGAHTWDNPAVFLHEEEASEGSTTTLLHKPWSSGLEPKSIRWGKKSQPVSAPPERCLASGQLEQDEVDHHNFPLPVVFYLGFGMVRAAVSCVLVQLLAAVFFVTLSTAK